MNLPDTAASNAAGILWGGGMGVTGAGVLTSNDIAAYGGLVMTIIGVLALITFKWIAYRRDTAKINEERIQAREYHEARMARLRDLTTDDCPP